MTVKTKTNKNYGAKTNTIVNPFDKLNGKVTLLIALLAATLPIIIQMIASVCIYKFVPTSGLSNAVELLIQPSNPLFIITFLGSQCIVALPILFVFRKHLKEVFASLKSVKNVLVITGITFGAMLLGQVWDIFVYNVLDVSVNSNQSTVLSFFDSLPILGLLSVGFLAPFLEEVTYRIGVFGVVKRFNKPLAYVLSAVLFAFAHFTYSGDLGAELLSLPTYIIIGLSLSYIYDKYGFAGSFLSHCLNNVIAVAPLFFVFN